MVAFASQMTPFTVIDPQGRIIGYYGDSPTFRVPSGWGASGAGGGMSANGSGGVTLYNKARIGGNGVSALVNLAKGVSALSAAPIVRVAARMLGPIALAGLAYDAYLTWDEQNKQWLTTDLATGIVSDGKQYRTASGVLWHPDKPTACEYFFNNEWSLRPGTSWSHDAAADRCRLQKGGSYYSTTYSSQVSTCPAGSYWVNGECSASAPTSVASDADMDTAITSALQASPSSAAQVLQQAIQATGQVPVADPIVSSGPASINGGQITSTSSGPAGISTTTTNTNYSVTYGGPVVTVTENKSVTYTAPDGSQTTTNDTTTPSADGEGQGVAPEPPKPLCEEFPDVSGCAKLGSGTDPGPVAEQPVQVNQITPESIGGSGGACPADRVMNTSYGTLTFSWSNLCGLAEGVRPVILAMAWLVAGFSFFFGAKRSGV